MQLISDEIQQILPHRYPFLLVDRITECEPGKKACGIKCVSANEMHFVGHFPQKKVIEALAQTGAVALLSEEKNKGHIALFAGIKNAKFKAQVTPGDVLSLSCEIIARKGPVGVGKAEAYVDGKLAVSAELTFAIE